MKPPWILVALAMSATTAFAQPVIDKTEADRLFEEGRTLLAAGQTEAACGKFEASIAKDPRAVGTLLNLALCNERQGKVATALGLFQEAFDRASEQDLPRQRQAAQKEIATLAAQVPTVTIKRTGSPLAGSKLVIDDKVVAIDKRELRLDPGRHEITLTAPGRMPYETTVTLKLSDHVELVLPELALPKERTVVVERSNPRRAWGKVATYGGAGIIATSIGFAIYSKVNYDAQYDDPDGDGPVLPHCGQRPLTDGKTTCDAAGKAAVDRSRVFGTTSMIVGVIGGAALVTGVLLWATAPPNEPRKIVPTVGADGAGVAFVGTF